METRTNPPAVVASLLDALDRVAFRSCYSADRAHCTMLARDLTEAAELAAFVVSAPAIGSDDRARAQRTIRLAAQTQPGAAAGTNVLDSAEWCHVPAPIAFAVLPHTYLPAELRRALTADARPAEPVSLTGRDLAALATVTTIAELPRYEDDATARRNAETANASPVRAFLPEVATAIVGDHPALTLTIRRAQSAYTAMYRADPYTAAAMWDAAQTAARAAIDALKDAVGPWGEPITLTLPADPELVTIEQCDDRQTCADCRAALDYPHYDGCRYHPANADPIATLTRQRADDRAVLAALAERMTARYDPIDAKTAADVILCLQDADRHMDADRRAKARAIIAGL